MTRSDISITVFFDRYFIVSIRDGYVSQHIPSQCVKLKIKRREKAAPGKALSEGFVVTHLCVPVFFESVKDLDVNLMPEGITIDELPKAITATNEGYKLIRKSGKSMDLREEIISINNDLIGFPNVFYLDREREKEARVGFSSLLSKIMRDLNWRYRRGWSPDDTRRQWNEYYEGVLGVVEDKKKREIIGPVQKRLTELLGSDFSSLELSLLNIEQPFTKAFLSLRSDLNQVDLGGVGSGISMVIALCLLEQISELSREEIIFLIDEPEMHLHPQLQKKIVKHFNKSNTQTIVTTHSPLFINLGQWQGIARVDLNCAVYPQDNIVCEVIEGKTLKQHLDEFPQWRQHQTIFFEEDPEILFARKVLLVEGPAEKYGIPRLAELQKLEFPELTVISCNGKMKIPYYVLLCRAFNIPAFVLFDRDDKNEQDAENARVLRFCEGMGQYSFTKSFEYLFGIDSDAKHKASKVLLKIDEVTDQHLVPDEVKEALVEIDRWYVNEAQFQEVK